MLGKIRKIKDAITGNYILPVTHSDAVHVDAVGTSLTTRLSSLGSGTVRFQKYSALGDSITKADTLTPYHQVAGTLLGIPTVINKGQNGTTIANTGAASMIFRYTSIASDSDLITVMGGTNDWFLNVPLGVITDNVDTTFYGALNLMCAGLISSYRDATIAFLTPLQRSNGASANTNGAYLTEFCDAIIAVCKKFSIPVLDLNRMGNFYPINSAFSTAYTLDGLHPNQAGHNRVGKPVAGFIKTL